VIGASPESLPTRCPEKWMNESSSSACVAPIAASAVSPSGPTLCELHFWRVTALWPSASVKHLAARSHFE
jgi:hypothetical protein